jgi:hypothetical protein
MRVNVPGGHAGHTQPAGSPLKPAVASPVSLKERPLELDPEMVGTERLQEPPQSGLVMDAPQCASAQADEPFGALKDRVQ